MKFGIVVFQCALSRALGAVVPAALYCFTFGQLQMCISIFPDRQTILKSRGM